MTCHAGNVQGCVCVVNVFTPPPPSENPVSAPEYVSAYSGIYTYGKLD